MTTVMPKLWVPLNMCGHTKSTVIAPFKSRDKAMFKG